MPLTKISKDYVGVISLILFLMVIIAQPITDATSRFFASLNIGTPFTPSLNVSESFKNGKPIILYSRIIDQDVAGSWRVWVQNSQGVYLCGGGADTTTIYNTYESGIVEFGWDYFFGHDGCAVPPEPYQICGEWNLRTIFYGFPVNARTCSPISNVHFPRKDS